MAAVAAPTRTRVLALALALWVFALVGGNGALYAYSLAPGEAAVAPPAWPAETRLERASDRPTLVLFAHPRCPCTRATMAELARVMTELGNRVDARVVFISPSDAPGAWRDSDLHRSAARIPGVRVSDDPGSVEMQRFGAKTSGEAQLFGRDGRLLFSGGITAARGHEGDNVGKSRIIALVNESAVERDRSAVFGCPLSERGALGLSWLRYRFID